MKESSLFAFCCLESVFRMQHTRGVLAQAPFAALSLKSHLPLQNAAPVPYSSDDVSMSEFATKINEALRGGGLNNP